MEAFFSRLLKPVKREGAERYLRFMLLAFAATVIGVRLLLSLTGYPQLGGGELHIAHLLWGWLALFIAALLPLIFSNRWVYAAGGVLSGLGVGLFIDEVGKFITRSNDYFYPAAAPIIYAFFLVSVLVYLQVRRPPSDDARAELYRAFDGMTEVLDRDLDPRERAELEARLQSVARQTANADYAGLARLLLDFVNSDTVCLVDPAPGPVARWFAALRAWEERWVTRPKLKGLLIAGLVLVSGLALVDLLRWTSTAVPAAAAEAGRLAAGQGAAGPAATAARSLTGFWLRLLLQGAVGLACLVASYLLAAARDRTGVAWGLVALLVSLTMLNLVLFYYDQFITILDALLQFSVFEGLLHYRQKYLAGGVTPLRRAATPTGT